MLAPVEGDAGGEGRWGILEVDVNVGSTTSAAQLLSELMKANLISGVRAYFAAFSAVVVFVTCDPPAGVPVEGLRVQ